MRPLSQENEATQRATNIIVKIADVPSYRMQLKWLRAHGRFTSDTWITEVGIGKVYNLVWWLNNCDERYRVVEDDRKTAVLLMYTNMKFQLIQKVVDEHR